MKGDVGTGSSARFIVAAPDSRSWPLRDWRVGGRYDDCQQASTKAQSWQLSSIGRGLNGRIAITTSIRSPIMGALELVASKSSLERFDGERGAGTLCRDFLVQNGLVMRAVGDTIVVAPPLILTHEQADELIEKTWKCLDLTQQAL